MTDRVPEPYWIEEIKREIKRLDNRLRRAWIKVEKHQMDDEDGIQKIYEKGFRDGLKWALKMRDGKSSRKQAWGKEE